MRISHYTRSENTSSALKNDSSEHSASDKNQIPNVSSFRRSPYSPAQINGSRSSHSESSQKSPVGISYDSSPSQKSSTPTHGEDLLLSSSLNQRSTPSEEADKNIRNPLSGLSHVSSVFSNHDKSSHREPIVSRNVKSETEDSSSSWHPTNGYSFTNHKSSHREPVVSRNLKAETEDSSSWHPPNGYTFTNHDKSSQKEPVISKNVKSEADDSNSWHPTTNGYRKDYVNSDSHEKPQNKISLTISRDSVSPRQVSPDSNSHCQSKESRSDSSKTVINGHVNNNSIKPNYNSHSYRSKVTSTTNGSCSNSPHSSSDSRDSIEYNSKYLMSKFLHFISDFIFI